MDQFAFLSRGGGLENELNPNQTTDKFQISHSHADDGKKQHSPYTLQQVDMEKKYNKNIVHHYRV